MAGAQGTNRRTLAKYEDHLAHYAAYLTSARRSSLLTARRKDVALFLAHLCEAGGEQPHPSRAVCGWCAERGFPDGRSGPGWSASTRKGYLAAIRFLYRHCHMEEDLPNTDPSAYLTAPKVVVRRGYTPTREEVQRLLAAPGRPVPRLLAHWMFFAPSRLQTFADARWEDIDLQQATWHVVGKGGKADVFDLHPLVVRELRHYARWQQDTAATNAAVRSALRCSDTAFVLLTRNGAPMRPSTIAKVLKWHAVRADVGVIDSNAAHDAPGGKTSRLSPHALRRAWATLALNDPDRPQPLDVVQEVLKHADPSTTRRHYAPTKNERARTALRTMSL